MGLVDLVIDAISALVLSHETWKQRFEDSFFCVRQEKGKWAGALDMAA